MNLCFGFLKKGRNIFLCNWFVFIYLFLSKWLFCALWKYWAQSGGRISDYLLNKFFCWQSLFTENTVFRRDSFCLQVIFWVVWDWFSWSWWHDIWRRRGEEKIWLLMLFAASSVLILKWFCVQAIQQAWWGW